LNGFCARFRVREAGHRDGPSWAHCRVRRFTTEDAGLDQGWLPMPAQGSSVALQGAGFDAIMFGNENDRPYEFDVDTASTATMAYVIGQLRSLRSRFPSASMCFGIR
jgi:hypothetical protein